MAEAKLYQFHRFKKLPVVKMTNGNLYWRINLKCISIVGSENKANVVSWIQNGYWSLNIFDERFWIRSIRIHRIVLLLHKCEQGCKITIYAKKNDQINIFGLIYKCKNEAEIIHRKPHFENNFKVGTKT